LAYLSSALGPDWTGEPLADALLTFAVPGVPLLAALVLWRMSSGFWPLPLAVGLLAVIYFAAVILIRTDYHDADGFTDCYPNCSLFQHSIGAAFWYGGTALVVSGLFCFGALVVVTAKGLRGEPSR
jgi:hypothetical protein